MKDLAKQVAELFGSREHDWKVTVEIDICRKCECEGYNTSPCKIPDPIDITKLGPALVCFRGLAVKLVEVVEKCYPGYNKHIAISRNARWFELWILYDAKPEQIWEINILAKESEK